MIVNMPRKEKVLKTSNTQRPTMPTTQEGWDDLEWLASEYKVDKRIITARLVRLLRRHKNIRSTVLQSFEDAEQPQFAEFVLQQIANGADKAKSSRSGKLSRPNVNVRQPKT